MEPTDWLLTASERGNPVTRLDRRRPDGTAWSVGNEARPLVHGATYFAELLAAVRALRAGDLLLFTDWRGDPDERLVGPGTEIGPVLRDSEEENRHLGKEVRAGAASTCWTCEFVPAARTTKARRPAPSRAPALDAAYIGGIDLSRSRNDDIDHCGDERAQPIADAYGPHPPWHDIQLAIRGPAVGDI
ncbi:hypothetical protein [Streptomyces sp. NPDC051219]|uniref:hypothetical protein n=1 Tax=Streptomyces sp. NPDC051219 TaxID=3155283 RepID=UPI0034235DBD